METTTLKVQAKMLAMSHMSDAQEEMEAGGDIERANDHINFAKYLMMTYANPETVVDADLEYAEYQKRIQQKRQTALKDVMKDIAYSTAEMPNGVRVNVLIYRGDGDPVEKLDVAVKEVLRVHGRGMQYNEFIDADMDNPWVRVVTIGKL